MFLYFFCLSPKNPNRNKPHEALHAKKSTAPNQPAGVCAVPSDALIPGQYSSGKTVYLVCPLRQRRQRDSSHPNRKILQTLEQKKPRRQLRLNSFLHETIERRPRRDLPTAGVGTTRNQATTPHFCIASNNPQMLNWDK